MSESIPRQKSNQTKPFLEKINRDQIEIITIEAIHVEMYVSKGNLRIIKCLKFLREILFTRIV